MSFKQFTVNRQIRYSILPDSQETGKHLLVALHGYGQLIEFFGKKFDCLGDDFVVVCPEGMHRFYLEGTSGRVGASWMTREWREQDISENSEALNQLIGSLIQELKPSKITVLGFSQGVATAARWLSKTAIPVDRFIAWAGVFPPDISIDNQLELPTERFAVIGTQDPYFTGEIANEMINLYTHLDFKVAQFEGKHEINQELLIQICKEQKFK